MNAGFIIFLLATSVSITFANRSDTNDAAERLKDAQTEYDNFRAHIQDEVEKAKLASNQGLVDFLNVVVEIKELFLQQAIWAEEEVLYQIDSQTLFPAIEINYKCLDFSRVLTENNMDVAGVEFSNCILDVDDQVKVEMEQVLNEMQQDGEVAELNVLGAMNRTNIITHPDQVLQNIERNLAVLKTLDTRIINELNVSINTFTARLGLIGKAYRACLMENDNILKAAFDNIRSQLVQICKGRLI
ncbi:uncharacterized protein LOC129747401 [Uranotaenia lowii]|uniref:uncharacterized protein LOC129747401 n=1 Tax=Uranotaenia lowii TaxID=190385 RepID=UPI002479DE93|nr:uncharacterized protein LOC129747401 [Uranotaenia lowii]